MYEIMKPSDSRWKAYIGKGSCGEGKLAVEGTAFACGKDIVFIILGGEAPHIGATVLAVPRPSLQKPDKVSASASVLCVTGHKEDEVAREIALRAAAQCNCVVTVVAGIHIEEASIEDIVQLKTNCISVATQLINKSR